MSKIRKNQIADWQEVTDATGLAQTANTTATDAAGLAQTASTTATDAAGLAQTASTTATDAAGLAQTANTTATDAAGLAQTANTTATGAADLAQTANTTAIDAATVANDKIAGFVPVFKTVLDGDVVVGTTGLEMETSVIPFADIVDAELYENGVCNDDATVTISQDVRLEGGVTVPVVVFTVSGLDNPILAGDKFKLKVAVKKLPIPN